MPNPQIIDPVTIQNLRALSPGDHDEFLRELIAIFIGDTPGRLDELEQGLRESDPQKFTRAAHSLKGSAANVGAVELRVRAEKLECEAREGRLAATGPLLAELRQAFAQATRELQSVVS